MLDEDLNPLLIEINQGPTLSISTAVTKAGISEPPLNRSLTLGRSEERS